MQYTKEQILVMFESFVQGNRRDYCEQLYEIAKNHFASNHSPSTAPPALESPSTPGTEIEAKEEEDEYDKMMDWKAECLRLNKLLNAAQEREGLTGEQIKQKVIAHYDKKFKSGMTHIFDPVSEGMIKHVMIEMYQAGASSNHSPSTSNEVEEREDIEKVADEILNRAHHLSYSNAKSEIIDIIAGYNSKH